MKEIDSSMSTQSSLSDVEVNLPVKADQIVADSWNQKWKNCLSLMLFVSCVTTGVYIGSFLMIAVIVVYFIKSSIK